MRTSRSIDWVAVTSKSPLVTVGLVDARGEICRQELTCLPAVVGRSGIAEVKVHDPWASRLHCAIAYTGDQLVVRDLESCHGTRVNGKPVRACRVREGDEIAIGIVTTLKILRIARESEFFEATCIGSRVEVP